MKFLLALCLLFVSASSFAFVNQKCTRIAGQAGPAEVRFVRILPTVTSLPCTVDIERVINKGTKHKDVFKSRNTLASCTKEATRQVSYLTKHSFACIDE